MRGYVQVERRLANSLLAALNSMILVPRPGMSTTTDHFTEAFSRNVGWLTPDEQRVLRTKRVAIAGLGGVGGSHLLTLTRLGVERFTIADPDIFEVVNLNRQAGAYVSTCGQRKVEVLARMARDINPDLDLRTFDTEIDGGNVSAFLHDADLYTLNRNNLRFSNTLKF